MRVLGRARDVVTPAAGGAPVVLAEDGFTALIRPDRIIAAIEAMPVRPALADLIGQSGSGGFRARLKLTVPEERDGATPLYLVLDDIPGASLVSGWAWSQWDADWLDKARASLPDSEFSRRVMQREGICIAHAPGSSALDPNSPARQPGDTPVPDLRHPDDPQGWHEFPATDCVGFRRARRIDIVLDDRIRVDSAFQDSANTPQGGRMAVHEYRLSVTADPQTLRLTSIDAEPRVLPHPECPSAVAGLERLIGTKMPELREKVLAELRGVAGCTHLNDAMRALAEVPALLSRLAQAGLPPAPPA